MTSKVNIAFLLQQGYSQRDHERFGIDILRESGHVVEIWDFTDFLHSPGSLPATRNSYTDSSHVRISNKKKIKSFLHKVSEETLVISLPSCSIRSKFMYVCMNKNKNTTYLNLLFGMIPPPSFPLWKRVWPVNLGRVKKLAIKVVETILRKNSYHPSVTMLSSCDSKREKKGMEIYSHALDYNIFLKERGSSGKCIQGEYALFLDSGESGLFHSDLLIEKMKELISPENYFKEMNDFFDFFESEYHIPVVVAVHPRVTYEGNEYGRRRMVVDKTHQLIRDSAVVIMHYSTAGNVAVMYNKPVYVLKFSKNYRNCSHKEYPGAWIKALKIKNQATLGDKNSFKVSKQLFGFDKKAYTNHMDAYVKCSGSPEVNTWKHLSDWLGKNSAKLFGELGE